MNITSVLFVFAFLPLSISLFNLSLFFENKIAFFKKMRLSDLCLILISLLFYAWAISINAVFLVAYILFLYFLAFLMKKLKCKKVILTISIILCLLVLCNYKYFIIFADSLFVPLGISFITFSMISFLVDTYKNNLPLNMIDIFLYVLFFPKIVCGPIVKYKAFLYQIYNRTYTDSKTIEGINLIIIGLAKKLIIADTFGLTVEKIESYLYSSIDVPTAIGLVILYSMQLYYDFSGYSDVAIGLAKLFGFSFEKNFDYPYTSLSITEFWRRWHISLGEWFKEYVYIPLGGNRLGKYRTIFNIFVVFLLTGVWHGAGMTYIIWGIMHGLFRIIERLLQDTKFYKKVPKSIKYIITISLVMFLWILFIFDNFGDIKYFLGILFGLIKPVRIPLTYKFYFNRKIVCLLFVAIYFATISRYVDFDKLFHTHSNTFTYVLKELLYMFLLIISILFLVNSTYSPFIYFQY